MKIIIEHLDKILLCFACIMFTIYCIINDRKVNKLKRDIEIYHIIERENKKIIMERFERIKQGKTP